MSRDMAITPEVARPESLDVPKPEEGANMAPRAEVAPTGSNADVPYDLTIDVFSQMVESGLIPQDRRVYLRDGRPYEKMAKTRAHGYVGAAIVRAVDRRLPDEWSLWPESTIVLGPTDAPLPDFAVIRGRPLDFATPARYPESGDIGLLIEIGVTSLRDDLTTRMEQYARALIPVYWVIDVLGRRILAHSEPRVVEGHGIYGRVEPFGPGQALPLVLDGREVARIPFDELLR
jgi:Uma2 family endonuclease